MVSSKLTKNFKQTLYYKKYKYKTSFYVKAIGRARVLKTIDEFRARLNHLVDNNWEDPASISKIDFSFIEKFIYWRDNIDKNNISFRIDFNQLSIYSNDLNYLINLESYFNTAPINLKEVIVYPEISDEKSMFFARTPPTKYRVYLKSGIVNAEVRKNILELINRYKNSNNQLIPSRSLTYWLEKTSWMWISQRFNIGYNDEQTYTLLALTMPDLLGKNYKLEKRKG